MSIKREYRTIEDELCIKSPITNEFTAIVDENEKLGESALCTTSGYCWSPSYNFDEMPDPVKAQSVEDELGDKWYPVTIRTRTWIIFRDGTEWTYADIIPIDESTPGFQNQIDMENKQVFDTFKLVSEYANNKG